MSPDPTRRAATATTLAVALSLAVPLTLAAGAGAAPAAQGRTSVADGTATVVAEKAKRLGPRAGNRLACDFDGDGHADQPIGVPSAEVAGRISAGAVTVLRGARRGLTARGRSYFHRGTRGVAGRPRANAQLGGALLCANLDGDRFADLVVGAPYDRGGSVQVFYGSRSGLLPSSRKGCRPGQQLLRRGTRAHGSTVPGSRRSTRFGEEITAGDFDRDGYDDLVVGELVLPGGRCGLLQRPARKVLRSSGSFDGRLRAGDVDGDGFDDLVSTRRSSEAVTVSRGGRKGLRRARARTVAPAPRFGAPARTGEAYHTEVATLGDLDGDGYDDVVIVTRTRPRGGKTRVHVFRGDRRARLTRQLRWDPFAKAAPGSGTPALPLVTEDLDGDGRAELVVLVGTDESLVVRGLTTGRVTWTRVRGEAASTGDHDGDGRRDLTMLSRAEQALFVHLGRRTVRREPDQRWTPAEADVPRTFMSRWRLLDGSRW